MTDAYANSNSEQYEFHDLYLWRETADLWTYSARFEGVMITASTAPNPDPAEIIDQLLHSAKAVREHPSDSARRMAALVDNDES